jgi:hypothetical protein
MKEVASPFASVFAKAPTDKEASLGLILETAVAIFENLRVKSFPGRE